MKNALSVVVVVLVFVSLCFAANTYSAPAAPAGTVQANNISLDRVPGTAKQVSIAPGEGSPMPSCQPGHCQDSLRMIGGEGSPMPSCQPGHCQDSLLPVEAL